MINEEFLAKLPHISTSCCLIHAINSYQSGSVKQDKQVLTLVKIFNRMSDNFKDFLCWCMQQRFTKNEMKQFQITKVCNATDLR